MKGRKGGFSLIELMIVVAVIAILAMIAVPSYQSYITKAKVKEAQSNLIALSLSAENLYQRTLTYPTETTTTTADTKTKFTSWNPSSTDFAYTYVSDGATYTLTATGTQARVTNCTLTLKSDGARSLTPGCGNGTDWAK